MTIADSLHEKARDYRAKARAAESQRDLKSAELWAVIAITLEELAVSYEEAAAA